MYDGKGVKMRKNKIVQWLVLGVMVFMCSLILTACGATQEGTGHNQETLSGTQIKIADFEQVDNTTYRTVVTNATENLDINDYVMVADDSVWSLHTDIAATKVIPSRIVSLECGDNTFYVLVTTPNQRVKLYTLQIRRRPMYTLSFHSWNNSNKVMTMIAEENTFVIPPEPSNPCPFNGYYFAAWDYDFNQPIVGDQTIDPIILPNEYQVIYYADHAKSEVLYTDMVTVEKKYQVFDLQQEFGYYTVWYGINVDIDNNSLTGGEKYNISADHFMGKTAPLINGSVIELYPKAELKMYTLMLQTDYETIIQSSVTCNIGQAPISLVDAFQIPTTAYQSIHFYLLGTDTEITTLDQQTLEQICEHSNSGEYIVRDHYDHPLRVFWYDALIKVVAEWNEYQVIYRFPDGEQEQGTYRCFCDVGKLIQIEHAGNLYGLSWGIEGCGGVSINGLPSSPGELYAHLRKNGFELDENKYGNDSRVLYLIAY